MREIKFRAFIKVASSGLPVNRMDYLSNQQLFEWEADGVGMEIMQFTGLKDKNGVEIYEGDIINFFFVDRFLDIMKYTKQVVVYENQMFSARFPLHKLRDIEVIGNIHSNPELLK